MQKRNVTDEEVIAAYNKHQHIGKIAAHLKVPHIQAWRLCQKLSLQMSRGGGAKKTVPLSEILDGLHPHFQTGKLKRKLLRESVFENACSICGLSEWRGHKLIMQLDHIDGDSSNHVLRNLRLLCPNCHSQTDTFCGRNKKERLRGFESLPTHIGPII